MDTIDVRGICLPNVPDTGEINPEDNYTIGNNVTSDIAIRKALNYGINRTALADGALNGLGVPCYDGIAHQLPWANPDAVIKDGDVAFANKTLEEAGWVDSDGDGIREKDGTKASFKVYYGASAPERQALAIGVSEQAKEFGIEIEPVGVGGKYYSSSPSNTARVNNSAVDAHIDAAFKESREASFKDWAAVSWDGSTGISPKGDAAWLWLGEIKYGYFVNDRVDISNDTALLQPHGGDLFSNVYDWTMTNSTA